jgi:hypothetical protein
VQTRLKLTLATLAALAAATFTPSLARADSVTVSTSGGATTDTVWTVADPTAGNYTVTVTGANRSTSSSDGNNYYRNSSNAGEDDRTITWTVSGLNPLYQITAFSFGTVKIVPSQGSGSPWSYAATLSATDLTTASTVSSTGTLTGTSAGPISPAIGITGDFGNAPAFAEFIDESAPTTSRVLGTRDFTITASPLAAPPTPEPASLGILAIGAVALLAKRRK